MQSYTSDLANWLVAVGTMALAITSVFHESIRRLFFRPRLTISISTEPPDCVKTQLIWQGSFVVGGVPVVTAPMMGVSSMTNASLMSTSQDPIPVYYLRVRVTNQGSAVADEVEMEITRVRRKSQDGKFRAVPYGVGNLTCASKGGATWEHIYPGRFRFFDLGRIVDPKADWRNKSEDFGHPETKFEIELNTKPAMRDHILQAGEYLFDVTAFAQNAKQSSEKIYLRHTGEWYDEESRMLSEGVGVRVEPSPRHLD
ncbi:MAG: hypothetical protein ACHQZQ_03445 [SAR324 cluster bacterium]